MMVEYGEFFWRDGWGPLYSVFGGNPLAAMPSLHFATSLMAALLLARGGAARRRAGLPLCATLGFALVYLGEHYVIDLLAGAALTGGRVAFAPRAAPVLQRLRRRRGGAGGERTRGEMSAGGERARRWQQSGAGRRRGVWRRRERDARRERGARTTRRCRVSSSRAGRPSRLACSCSRSSAFLYFVLPKLAGVGTTLHHIEHGDGGGSRSVSCSSCCRSPATWCCSAPCS